MNCIRARVAFPGFRTWLRIARFGCRHPHLDRFYLPVAVTPPAASCIYADRGRSSFGVFPQFDGVAEDRVRLADRRRSTLSPLYERTKGRDVINAS